jgi:hypothetical protein
MDFISLINQILRSVTQELQSIKIEITNEKLIKFSESELKNI